MRILLSIALLFALGFQSEAQYAPRDNWLGSTAIPGDSNIFVNWGFEAKVERGFMDIRNPQLGPTSAGKAEMTTSYPDGQAVSLGDGGIATLTFDVPIVDGPGFDFAVFENGFHIRTSGDSDFLELAFVEVSSDGQRWVRFASFCDNDTVNQLQSYDGMKASSVHNLAGKYVGNYGTPFDLSELKDSLGIDITNIKHVRVIDVVGSLDPQYASYDSRGHKINDPFPTNFLQGGFDLDAIGVIHNQHMPNGIEEIQSFQVFPNPAQSGQSVQIATEDLPVSWKVYQSSGKLISSGNSPSITDTFSPGTYFIEVRQGALIQHHKLIIQ